mgnify:CR=1 FL=1
MRTVDKEIFYHVSRGGQWQVGQQYFVGDSENYYTQKMMNASFMLPVSEDKPPLPINFAGRAMVEYLQTGQQPAPLQGIYHFQYNRTIQELYDMGQTYLHIVREMVFEEVRKEKFSDLPSRRNGMWVIPDNKAALAFWLPKLKGDNGRILKVALSGKLHQGAQPTLALVSYPANEMKKAAHDYWTGAASETDSDECLFIGNFKVIEEMGPK